MEVTAKVMEGSPNYPCVVCGSPGQVIKNSVDPRIKCTRCQFMYNASESTKMKEAGQLPDAAPQLQDPNPPTNTDFSRQVRSETSNQQESSVSKGKLPRSLAYLIVSKDRSTHEYTSEKDLKKAVLRWEGQDKAYEVFQLTQKKVQAKVDIE